MNDPRFVIFVVDDDPGVLKALSRMLDAKGYEVRAFSSSAEFLAQHDPSIPGCAIFDVSMPGLDGIELQAALKAGGVERPVIFITGVGDIPTLIPSEVRAPAPPSRLPARPPPAIVAISPAW